MRKNIPDGSLSRKLFRLLGLVALVFCCLYGYLVSLQFPMEQVTRSDVKFFTADHSVLPLETQPQSGDTQATAASQTSAAIAALPSGEAMPIGDLPGWYCIFAEDFTINVPTGEFPGSYYYNSFTVYPDGTPDTAGKNGGPSRYYPSRVLSVNNGLLNLYLHSENGTPMSAAVLPILPENHLYGKYSVRFRADPVAGFKAAWLLWPDSEVWPWDGEINFPEGSLTGSIDGFVHHQGGKVNNDQDGFTSRIAFTSWHTASIEWTPGKVVFLLDGSVFGVSTKRVPNTPMHWVLQTEACITHCPATYGSGYLQIDWVAAYSMAS